MSRWRALGGVSRGPRQERHSIYVGSLTFKGSCSVSVAGAGSVITRPLLGSIDLLAQLPGHGFAYTGVSSWVGSMEGTRTLYSGRLETAGSCVTTAPSAAIAYAGRADFRGLALPALSLAGRLDTLGQCRVAAPSVAPTYAGLMDLRGVLTPVLPYLGKLDLRGAELTSPRYLGSLDTLGSCATASPSIVIYSGLADFQGLVRPANSLIGLLSTLGQCQVAAPSVASTYAGLMGLLGRAVTASQYRGRLDTAGQCQVTAPAVAANWPNNYRYRARIVVPATSIQWATGTLPMVVFINETKAELAHTSSGGLVRSLTGADIRFEDISGNKIPHGFESYDPVTGAMRVWVRPPPPTGGSSRVFYIFIGNPSVGTPTSPFVQLATTHAFDAGRTQVVPTGATQGVQKVLRPTVDNTTFDMRDVFISTNHRDITLAPLRAYIDKAGMILTGAKIVGEQDNTLASWGQMEYPNDVAGSHVVDRHESPGAPSAYHLNKTNDFSDNGITVTGGKAGAGGLLANTGITIENCALYGQWDSLNPTETETGLNTFRGVYVRDNRDDSGEFDNFADNAAYQDCLLDGIYTLYSHRGTNGTYSISYDHCVVWIKRYPYDFGGVLDDVPNVGTKYTTADPTNLTLSDPARNPWNVDATWGSVYPGCLSASGYCWGFVGGKLFKLDTGTIQVTMTNTIIVVPGWTVAAHVSTQTDANLNFPAGTYTNVAVVWQGPGAYPGVVQPGITVYDSTKPVGQRTADGLALATAARSSWLSLHGNFDGTGNDFTFLHTTAAPTPVATEEDWASTSADFHAWWNCATGKDRCAAAHDLAAQGGPIAATVLKGMQACDLNGTSQWFEAAHYATWGGWGAVTLDTWSQADAILPPATGTPPTGAAKAIFCEGPHETSANDSMALYYRGGTTVAPTTPDPILFNVTTAHGDPAFIGWAISTANQQVATPVHLAGTWSSPNVPKLYKSGAVLTLSSTASATGTVWQASGGPIMIGHGPSIANFPGTPWAGLISMCRVRTIEVTPAQLLTEFNNQNDASAFYGFGGWDQFADANLAPIAVPAPMTTVAWSASGIAIDVLANDIDPESGALTLDSVQNPPTGQGTCALGTGTNLNKVIYTPPAGFSGAVGFFYTCKDIGGKISRGRQLLNVTAAAVNLEIPTPLRVIWGNAALDAGIDDTKLTNLLAQTATSTAWPTGVFSTPAGAATHFKLEPGDHVMLAAGNFDTTRNVGASPGFATVFDKVGSASAPIVFRAVPAAMAFTLGDAGHTQVDHTKDIAGYPENAPGNPNANNNMGLLSDAARTTPIITVAGRVNIRGTWGIRGQDCIFYGLLFIGGNGRLHFGGLRNTALRCEFTGWFRGRAACAPSRWSNVEQDCAIRYCTFHEPAEWGVAGGGEPADASNSATQANWPPARAGRYTKQLKGYSQDTGDLKFAIRWYNDNIEGAFPQCAKNVWIQRCLLRDLISKPDPGDYGTGQTDAIEPGGNVNNGQGTPTYTIDTIGGLKFVAAISNYTNFAPLVERCVIARHHEGAGAAIFDCKMSGIVARKMTFINNQGTGSPDGGSAFDLRGCWFSTFQDIDMSQSGGMLMRVNGFGHTLQRIRTNGPVQVCCGDANAVGDFTDQPDPFHYEAADSISLEDITIMDSGDALEIGKLPGTGYNQFPVRRITVNRSSKTPQQDAANILAGTVTITNTGVGVQLPQNCPTEAEVGWRAAWQGDN